YSKMFVGGLSWDTTDAEGLRSYFSEFGKVDACTIVRDADGKSRGFAFLTFEDPASVNAVMIREHFLDGKAIDPKRAIPREEHLRNTRYFVGGLAPQTTSDSMRAFFGTFGKVVDATVMVDRETGRSKGFGFVTFEDNSNDAQLVGKLGLVLDEKQVCGVRRHRVRGRSGLTRESGTSPCADRSQDGPASQPARPAADGRPRRVRGARRARQRHGRQRGGDGDGRLRRAAPAGGDGDGRLRRAAPAGGGPAADEHALPADDGPDGRGRRRRRRRGRGRGRRRRGRGAVQRDDGGRDADDGRV
ncbi:hypothetical protein OF83DRAFT_1063745, partial [Amylostereum chailletii]